jgi:hypothetical protein
MDFVKDCLHWICDNIALSCAWEVDCVKKFSAYLLAFFPFIWHARSSALGYKSSPATDNNESWEFYTRPICDCNTRITRLLGAGNHSTPSRRTDQIYTKRLHEADGCGHFHKDRTYRNVALWKRAHPATSWRSLGNNTYKRGGLYLYTTLPVKLTMSR